MKSDRPPTRILIVYAGPTPWEQAERVVGNQSLPLTEAARAAIDKLVTQLPDDVGSVYCCRTNEACEEVGKMIAGRFDLRVRDQPELCGFDLGLWQGLTYGAIRTRFPTIVSQWEKNPAAVQPPDGETLVDAIARISGALRSIVKRRRSETTVIILRPLDLRIAVGLFKGEPIDTIAASLQESPSLTTIDLDDASAKAFASNSE